MSSLEFTARDGSTQVRPLFAGEIETVKFTLGSATVGLSRSSHPDGSQTLDVFLRQNLETTTRAAPAPRMDKRLNEKYRKEVRQSLMVVFALFATITFSAGLNPPGGFWQDDSGTPSGPPSSDVTVVNACVPGNVVGEICNTSLANNAAANGSATQKPHRAGDPIFPVEDKIFYNVFTWLNSVAFVYSLVSIFYLLLENAFNKDDTVRNLKFVAGLDLLLVLGAYVYGLARSEFPIANLPGRLQVLLFAIILVSIASVLLFLLKQVASRSINGRSYFSRVRSADLSNYT